MEQEQLDTLKERIYAFMREDAYRPLPEAELRTGLGLPESEGKELSDALAALEAEGAVIRNRSGLYGLPSRMNLVVGRLSMSPKGFGFIIPDVRETEEETDVFVPGSAMGTAMHGDRVVARVTPSEQPGRAREGEIIRILERVNTHIVRAQQGVRLCHARQHEDRARCLCAEKGLWRSKDGQQGRCRDHEMAGAAQER